MEIARMEIVRMEIVRREIVRREIARREIVRRGNRPDGKFACADPCGWRTPRPGVPTVDENSG
jgi:hypothetical protein